jgi:antitoxin FitA
MEPILLFLHMATITIKNIPDDIYERLKKLAKARHRSVNSEIINLLEQSVRINEIDPSTVRENARKLRESITIQLTPEEIEAAINEGRP